MQLHCVVTVTVTTEGSAEEVRRGILKTRDATILTLAVFLVVAIAAASSSPVSAQYAPCPPGYSYVGASCYPGYNNPYGNSYNGQYNPYNNCQTGYYYQNNGCYYPGYNNPYRSPYNPYRNPYYRTGRTNRTITVRADIPQVITTDILREITTAIAAIIQGITTVTAYHWHK